MPTAENAKLEYEAGQTGTGLFGQLTNSGDAQTFTSSADLWSGKSGYSPSIRPNGLVTGGAITPAVSGSNDVVDVAAITCYLAGEEVTVSAGTDVSITRAVSTDTHIINSITVNSSGAIAVVAGTDGTAFVSTRGAAGGPPLIPVDSIEIGQVRTTSFTAAAIAANEIFQVVGTHTERYDYPLWNVSLKDAQVEFLASLPLIHTGGVAKQVFAKYYEPEFSEIPRASEFVPPETSYSVNSTQVYGSTIGSSSKSLSGGSFSTILGNGVTDAVVAQKGQQLWFRFYPDRLSSPYILANGILGISRQFPAGDSIVADCTIAAEEEAVNVEA